MTMDKKTKVNVRIMGNEYTIVGTESEEYINKVCYAVDKKMKEISKNPIFKPHKVAVLTAINMCDEYYKAKYMNDLAGAELKKTRDELASLKAEMKALEEENKYLKQEFRKNGIR
ncbi:MAG: cell division protein ZapA [Clostridia bacterium]|nr:cell division protein ZapA [Clostridia bacterium]